MLEALSSTVTMAMSWFRSVAQTTAPFSLSIVTKPVKYIFLLILLLNIRSAPFSWHLRIFRPYFVIKLKWWSMFLRSRKYKERWLEQTAPVGANPLERTTTYNTWASLDDCDYNMHLSNSSYAKSFDMVRMKAGFAMFLPFLSDGGWLALSGTHYHFIREIPIFASYKLKSRIVAYDNKWIYIVAYFVTKGKKGKKDVAGTGMKKIDNSSSSITPSENRGVSLPAFHTPASASDVFTPTESGGAALDESKLASALGSLTSNVIAPDEVLHCVGIAQCCAKVGRITIPPVIALMTQGFSLTTEQWDKVLHIRRSGGMRKFLAGGWKEIPESERWWNDVYAPLEPIRARNLAACDRIKTAMELARDF